MSNKFITTFMGALVAIMILFNGTLARTFGSYTSLIIIHFVGLIVIIAVMAIKKVKVKLNNKLSIYLYTSGAIGVITILFNNIAFDKLGVSIPIAIMLLGQSVTSVIIDHFGLLQMKKIEFKKKKIYGLMIIVLGIILMTVI